MDQTRLERAAALRAAYAAEEAAREFRAMAHESANVCEKSVLMLYEARCYADLGRVADAEHIVARIREMAPEDNDVRLSVQLMSASLAGQAGHHAEALCQFQEILQQFVSLLRTDERRDLYEEIQQRRAFSLVHLARYRDALPILNEAASFSTLQAEDLQEVHLYLGTSYAALNDNRLAKQEFLRATEFDLGGSTEAQARYNLGVIYFQEGGFAQAKHQLEQVLRTHPEAIPNLPHRYIYQQLSWVCGRLGEEENAERYKRLADASTR
jgi:tetratricopeptide (TPR) repeat protein